jgi:hypothetical protein
LVGSSSSEFDPYRSKVAEEMLLCEVIVQICRKKRHLREEIYGEGAVQQDGEKFISRRGSCRQTASIFKRLCLVYSRMDGQTGYG